MRFRNGRFGTDGFFKICVMTGRRRIGKTQLLLKATEGQSTLYFFVARKAESFLCQDFAQEIKISWTFLFWEKLIVSENCSST